MKRMLRIKNGFFLTLWLKMVRECLFFHELHNEKLICRPQITTQKYLDEKQEEILCQVSEKRLYKIHY